MTLDLGRIFSAGYGVLEKWDFGIMEFWENEIWENEIWENGSLGKWEFGNKKVWENGISYFYVCPSLSS